MPNTTVILVNRTRDCDGAGWEFARCDVPMVLAVTLELAITARQAALKIATEHLLNLAGAKDKPAAEYIRHSATELAKYDPRVKTASLAVDSAEDNIRHHIRHVLPEFLSHTAVEEGHPMLESEFDREYGDMLSRKGGSEAWNTFRKLGHYSVFFPNRFA